MPAPKDEIVRLALRTQRIASLQAAGKYITLFAAEGLTTPTPSEGVLQGFINTVQSHLTTVDRVNAILRGDA